MPVRYDAAEGDPWLMGALIRCADEPRRAQAIEPVLRPGTRKGIRRVADVVGEGATRLARLTLRPAWPAHRSARAPLTGCRCVFGPGSSGCRSASPLAGIRRSST